MFGRRYHSRREILTCMLLVANLANAKLRKKSEKCLKPWKIGTHLRVSNVSYLLNSNMVGFRWFSKIFVLLCFAQK